MKFVKELEGDFFNIELSTEDFATSDPPLNLWVASNFNGWSINDPSFKIPGVPARGPNSFLPLRFNLPKDIGFFEFKIYDKTYNRWCECDPNPAHRNFRGNLYAGMEAFFVVNIFGTFNVRVDL